MELDPASMSPDAHLAVSGERKRRGACHHAAWMLQQCASQHRESMEMQHQQHKGIVDLLNCQEDRDKRFEDSLLAAMRMEAQEDRKLMAMAFRENLQLLQELFSAISEMSQTMTAYYQEKAMKWFGFCGRGTTLANCVAPCNAQSNRVSLSLKADDKCGGRKLEFP